MLLFNVDVMCYFRENILECHSYLFSPLGPFHRVLQTHQSAMSDPSASNPGLVPVDSKPRWTFEVAPKEVTESVSPVVPFGCVFSPFSAQCVMQRLNSGPVICRQCHSVLSSANSVDLRNRTWQCVFCNCRSGLPPTGAEMFGGSEPQPDQSVSEHFAVDYMLKSPETPGGTQTVHLFVVDVCVSTTDELTALKEHLLQSITLLPPTALVGLITFGAVLELHELVQQDAYCRTHAFRGSTEYSSAQIREILSENLNASQFIAPVVEAEFLLSQQIDQLSANTWPEARGLRPIRCTGSALSLAAGILDIFFAKKPARIIAFLSGVCSEGPGKAVELSKANLIRSHADIRRGTEAGKFWASSVSFYSTIMQKMVVNSHVLDVCSASLDQTGIAEMKKCIECTGGYLLMVDSWRKPTLQQNLQNILTQRVEFAYNVSVEVKTSIDWKIMGSIGPFTGALKNSNSISSVEMGLGKTCQWVTSRMDSETSIATYFELLPCRSTHRYVQFLVTYTNERGETRLRVHTNRHPSQAFTQPIEAAQYFDQEAAAVLISRHCSFRCESQPPENVRRWLDSTLIKFVHSYAEFMPKDANSLRLSSTMSFFPIFMYHLRRSPFLLTFNSSPDETAHYRLHLYRNDVYHSILMIHPTLISYAINAAPRPIPLDEEFIDDKSIHVLDTFFDVLIYYGQAIQSWRRAGFEAKNADFRAFCANPLQSTASTVRTRNPCPQIIECTKGDPASRILLHKLNSAKASAESASSTSLVSDDISLQSFTAHLKQKVVNF